jgi:hypothetical protein
MMKLMSVPTHILALLVATTMIGSVATMNLQQAFAFGFVERQQIGEFQKLTAQFEKAVINSISNPEISPQPHLSQDFLKLTGEFKTDVINAVLVNPPEPDKIPEFHKVYTDGVLRIFLGGPDTIPELLQDYGRNVFQIFGFGPR